MKVLNKLTNEYIDDVLTRLAHNSSAIEGNTLSYNQTVSIILYRIIPQNSNINVREFYEVENHRFALEYILEKLNDNNQLNLTIIKEINSLLMDHLNVNKGKFKTDYNAIKGADFETASPKDTPFLMQQWVDNLNYRLFNENGEKEKIKIILEAHINFERIHPFSDGNGRTGRMLMLYSLLEHDLVPFIIPVEYKNKYYDILMNQDIEEFYKFIIPLKESEEKRIDAFYNKEKINIFEDECIEM